MTLPSCVYWNFKFPVASGNSNQTPFAVSSSVRSVATVSSNDPPTRLRALYKEKLSTSRRRIYQEVEHSNPDFFVVASTTVQLPEDPFLFPSYFHSPVLPSLSTSLILCFSLFHSFLFYVTWILLLQCFLLASFSLFTSLYVSYCNSSSSHSSSTFSICLSSSTSSVEYKPNFLLYAASKRRLSTSIYCSTF